MIFIKTVQVVFLFIVSQSKIVWNYWWKIIAMEFMQNRNGNLKHIYCGWKKTFEQQVILLFNTYRDLSWKAA